MEPPAHLKHLIKPCSVHGRRIDGMGNLMQVRIPTQHASISHFHVLHDWFGREWHRAALSPADGNLALRLPRYSLGGRHLQVRNGATWEEAICFPVLVCRREVADLACWQTSENPLLRVIDFNPSISSLSSRQKGRGTWKYIASQLMEKSECASLHHSEGIKQEVRFWSIITARSPIPNPCNPQTLPPPPPPWIDPHRNFMNFKLWLTVEARLL